jgi:hypothetical protein
MAIAPLPDLKYAAPFSVETDGTTEVFRGVKVFVEVAAGGIYPPPGNLYGYQNKGVTKYRVLLKFVSPLDAAG